MADSGEYETVDYPSEREQFVGAVSLLAFLGSIPFANHWLTVHGMWETWLGPVPSAVWVVAFSFVWRDLAQITLWVDTFVMLATPVAWLVRRWVRR